MKKSTALKMQTVVWKVEFYSKVCICGGKSFVKVLGVSKIWLKD
jgi:hypothetical protein